MLPQTVNVPKTHWTFWEKYGHHLPGKVTQHTDPLWGQGKQLLGRSLQR